MEKSITPFVYRGPVILAPQKMGDVQTCVRITGIGELARRLGYDRCYLSRALSGKYPLTNNIVRRARECGIRLPHAVK